MININKSLSCTWIFDDEHTKTIFIHSLIASSDSEISFSKQLVTRVLML